MNVQFSQYPQTARPKPPANAPSQPVKFGFIDGGLSCCAAPVACCAAILAIPVVGALLIGVGKLVKGLVNKASDGTGALKERWDTMKATRQADKEAKKAAKTDAQAGPHQASGPAGQDA